MKPYVLKDEVVKEQGENCRTYRLLGEATGCINGCCSGTTVYADTEFSDHPGWHEDQEGFYVLEGEGFVKLDELIVEIKEGDSFVAMPGVTHTLKSKENSEKPLKVFWFHGAI